VLVLRTPVDLVPVVELWPSNRPANRRANLFNYVIYDVIKTTDRPLAGEGADAAA